ncbi:MAG: aspartate aminotransferase family protein [Actinomycetota bacterium]
MTASWEERFAARAPASGKIHEEARRVLAGGMTHDNRFIRPFPLAIERAEGAVKWDPDGNEYIDYVLGHGALLLGHGHPATVEAVREQVGHGTHYGAAHRAEVEWGELVCDLIPSAERVRFTSSGTEANMLALRVARAFTGRPVVVKFDVHFHGWSDIGVIAQSAPFDVPASPGLSSASNDIVALPIRDRVAIEQRLSIGDVAAVILEPSGAHFGEVPLEPDTLSYLRDVTQRHGTLLIFDEVITGFRWAPGGAQERFGVVPDLTALAKILGGGLPAGAVGGRADILEGFDLRGDRDWDRFRHVFHPGTFNANPLSAAAGIATLNEVATGEPTRRAEETADELRRALNDVLRRAGIAGKVYGEASVFHIYLGAEPSAAEADVALSSMRGELGRALRTALLTRGVDLMRASGMVSWVHGDREVDKTAAAFEASLKELADAGVAG